MVGGGTMASAEHKPIMEVGGQSPQCGPGAESLVRGAKPPEAESILVIGCPTEPEPPVGSRGRAPGQGG